MKSPNISSLVLIAIYFFITTVVINLIWGVFVSDKLYHCGDEFIFPFYFPPYAHEGVPADYYVAPKQFVDSLGIIFIILNYLIPIVAFIFTPKRIKDKY